MAKLSVTKVAGKLAVGLHGDGGGLYLRVQQAGKGWIFRYRFAGKRHVRVLPEAHVP
ncbi:MAG: Arm DNA-binding domain-containing protein, partial [Alphaproteobacteria bacterium]